MKLASNPKLCDWAAYWMETYVRPVAKPSGYEHYHDNLYKHILPKLGEYRLKKLTTPVVQAFLNEASYPVTVDPTVTVEETYNPDGYDDYNAIEDLCIYTDGANPISYGLSSIGNYHYDNDTVYSSRNSSFIFP